MKKICQRCRGGVMEVIADSMQGMNFTLPSIDYYHGDPEADCEFWAHFAFNKLIKYFGFRSMTNEEKETLFETMKNEAPEMYLVLKEDGLVP